MAKKLSVSINLDDLPGRVERRQKKFAWKPCLGKWHAYDFGWFRDWQRAPKSWYRAIGKMLAAGHERRLEEFDRGQFVADVSDDELGKLKIDLQFFPHFTASDADAPDNIPSICYRFRLVKASAWKGPAPLAKRFTSTDDPECPFSIGGKPPLKSGCQLWEFFKERRLGDSRFADANARELKKYGTQDGRLWRDGYATDEQLRKLREFADRFTNFAGWFGAANKRTYPATLAAQTLSDWIDAKDVYAQIVPNRCNTLAYLRAFIKSATEESSVRKEHIALARASGLKWKATNRQMDALAALLGRINRAPRLTLESWCRDTGSAWTSSEELFFLLYPAQKEDREAAAQWWGKFSDDVTPEFVHAFILGKAGCTLKQILQAA